jgi:hypothetical protein
MLIPHPAFLRELVDEYEVLAAEEAASGPSPRARDLAYTLCVSTGTREVTLALEAAHRLLAAAPEKREPSAAPVASKPSAVRAEREPLAVPVAREAVPAARETSALRAVREPVTLSE